MIADCHNDELRRRREKKAHGMMQNITRGTSRLLVYFVFAGFRIVRCLVFYHCRPN